MREMTDIMQKSYIEKANALYLRSSSHPHLCFNIIIFSSFIVYFFCLTPGPFPHTLRLIPFNICSWFTFLDEYTRANLIAKPNSTTASLSARGISRAARLFIKNQGRGTSLEWGIKTTWVGCANIQQSTLKDRLIN